MQTVKVTNVQEQRKELLKEANDRVISWIERYVMSRYGYPLALYRNAWNYLDRGGKRYRVALAYVVGDMLDTKRRYVDPPAASVELIHNASLIADDVADKPKYRRGQPPLHEQVGIPAAINAFYFLDQMAEKSLRMGHELGLWKELHGSRKGERIHYRLQKIREEVSERLVAGQQDEWSMRQMIEERDVDLDHLLSKMRNSWYIRMVSHKTVPLIEFAILSPIIIAGGKENYERAARYVARHAGIAFQCVDDIIKVDEDLDEIGKITLLISETFRSLSRSEKRKFLDVYLSHKKTSSEKKELKAMMYPSFQKVKSIAQQHIRKSVSKIRECFPKNDYRDLVIDLLNMAVERTS